jgi:hypothetical protein
MSNEGLVYKIKCLQTKIRYVLRHGGFVKHNDTNVFELNRHIANMRVEQDKRRNRKPTVSPGCPLTVIDSGEYHPVVIQHGSTGAISAVSGNTIFSCPNSGSSLPTFRPLC